jgi:CRISPR-associated protein Cas1
MKKLLNTLYIVSPEKYLALDGETVVIKEEDQRDIHVPLHNLEAIVSFGYRGASPALMAACARYHIPLVFLSQSGRFLARVTGETHGNVLLRKRQYAVSENPDVSLLIAKNCIMAKVYNSRWILERAIRDHAMRLDTKAVKAVSSTLKDSLVLLENSDSLDTLRGYEGECASRYFSVFDELILQQEDEFRFDGRNRRPPLDNTNALLSFVYTLLAQMVAGALEAVGLDPYIGFLHQDRPGRISLALDLMEELRPVLADRFVLTLINKRMVEGSGFTKKENGAVMMDDDTRSRVLTEWQNRKKETLIHPYLNEKVEWGMIPYVQALLLARYLRGDLDAYPAFFWK